MITRNVTLCVMILCFVSLYVGVPFAAAHNGTQTEKNELDEAKVNLENAKGEQPLLEVQYDGARRAVDVLLDEWDANAASIQDNTWDVANAIAATAISLILEGVLTDDRNDGGAMKKAWLTELVEHLPAVLSAINAGKNIWDLRSDLSKRAAYLLALNSAVAALDEVISENLKAFNTYESKYDIYVDKMQNHKGGLVRVPNYSSTGDYNSVQPSSLQIIKDAVKAKGAYNAIDSQNKLMYWYHVNDLKSDSVASKKSFHRFYGLETSFWSRDPLPKNKACGGDCGQQFQTPVEHLVICPYSLTDSSLQAGDRELTDLPIDALLNGAVSPAGCNKTYYLCSSSDREKHKISICGKKKNDVFCHERFRECSNSRCNKSEWWHRNNDHMEIVENLGLWPKNGLLNAVPGDSHRADVSVPAVYNRVEWFVASPGVSGRGTLFETDYGDGSSMTAHMTYSFPSGVSGDYLITAVVYGGSDPIVSTWASYTVSVGSSSTSTVTLSPSNGSYTVSAGDSHNAVLSILSKGASIGFYVITPNDAINVVSTFLETWAGDGTASAASIDYTFPSNVSGDYTFYATISYNDGTSHSPHPSYTVAVSTPPPPTTTLLPANGLYTATDANSHTANFSISEAYSSVKWHVKSPSETGLGTRIETDYGDGSTTTADFTYTFPLNVSGDYVITANGLTSSGLSFEDSYTVSVTIFIPSFSLSTSTYSPGSRLSVSVSANETIFGCHLFVRSPGDTSTYGTKIGWFGNSRSTSQSISYTLPTTAASGRYKITVRAYPWYGNTYGAPKYLQKYVNVSSD